MHRILSNKSQLILLARLKYLMVQLLLLQLITIRDIHSFIFSKTDLPWRSLMHYARYFHSLESQNALYLIMAHRSTLLSLNRSWTI